MSKRSNYRWFVLVVFFFLFAPPIRQTAYRTTYYSDHEDFPFVIIVRSISMHVHMAQSGIIVPNFGIPTNNQTI